MKKRILVLALFSAAVFLISSDNRQGWARGDRNELQFSEARIIIEYNSSDEDIGVQVFLDGEPWKKVTAFSPNGRRILDIMTQRSLNRQGITELFFESSEPSLADFPLEAFLARFPEGEYEFEGRTIEGRRIEAEANLTHVIPKGPEIISPASPNDDLPVVDPANAVISWEPVTETIQGSEDIEIKGYQVIVEQVKPLRMFSVDLPASVNSLKIPPEFFAQRNTRHKFEVLAIEAGGNQTITESEFMTAE